MAQKEIVLNIKLEATEAIAVTATNPRLRRRRRRRHPLQVKVMSAKVS